MERIYTLLACGLLCMGTCLCQTNAIKLDKFQMANSTSPAFLLLEETVTDVYTPENVKALALHVQDNLGQSMAIELAPYFFINPKGRERTYYRYVGVYEDTQGKIRQNPFSGLNTTTVSFAYLKKDYENIAGEKQNKLFALGARTTILRFLDKERILRNARIIAGQLQEIGIPPQEVMDMPEGPDKTEAIRRHYVEGQRIAERLKVYQKTVKPIFKLDLAGAYSELFVDNSTDSKKVSRAGAWITGELSQLINDGDDQSTTNNYINLLFMARYVQDGFNSANATDFSTSHYRDFGGKVSLEAGKFSLAYEYISRNGSISSRRSVGSLSFAIDRNITLTGGFGRDFNADENLLALFGINWGFNLGNTTVGM